MGPGDGPKGLVGRMKRGREAAMDHEGLMGYWDLKGYVVFGHVLSARDVYALCEIMRDCTGDRTG
jgi:hypothetical protein